MSQQINLFDESLRSRRPPLDLTMMLTLLAIAIAGLLGSYELGARQLVALEKQRSSLDGQAKELQARLAQLGGATRAPDRGIVDEIARLDSQVQNWQRLLERLSGAGIGNTEGHAAFLEALAREHVEGVWLTEVRVGEEGGEFALRGRALRPELLASYIKLLNREEALRGRVIGQMDVSQKTTAADTAPGRGASKTDAAPKGPEMRFVEFLIASATRTPEADAARQPERGGVH